VKKLPAVALLIALASCLVSSAAFAQTIRGTVLRQIDRLPVRGAVVLLLKDDQSVAARTLTSAQGLFTLRAPENGSYRVQTLRIGFRPAITDRFALRADTAMTLELSQVPVALPAVTAQELANCDQNPRRGLATAVLWEEAKTAILAADITINELNYEFDVMLHSRKYDTREPPELLETLFLRERHQGTRPWSSFPPDTLERRGYVSPTDSGLRYVAPDLEVLLSPYFTRTHCFRVREARRTPAGMMALEFAPVSTVRRAEIKGVLLFEDSTRLLRRVQFQYVNLPATVADTVAGGEIEFAQLPNGAWILPRWLIRAPVPVKGQLADTVRRAGSAVNVWSYLPTDIPQTSRLRVTGGDLLTVRAESGAPPLWRRPLSTLALTVFERDSTRDIPVSGAQVGFAGSAMQVVSDDRGLVQFDGMVEGEYMIEVSTPLYSALGLRPERLRVRFPDAHTNLTERLRVKTLPELVRQACGLDSRRAALIGTVIRDGAPVMRAPVRVEPAPAANAAADTVGTAETMTGPDGRYAVCNVPMGVEFIVTVTAPDGTRVRRSVRMEPAEGVTFMDIVFP
jgi:hypothetical protein